MKRKTLVIAVPTLEIFQCVSELYEKYGCKVDLPFIKKEIEKGMDFWAISFYHNEDSLYAFVDWYKKNDDEFVLFEYNNDLEQILLRDGWLRESDRM